MTIDDIPEPLLGIMKANFNTEALGGSGSINLRDVLKRNPAEEEEFRQQFASMIIAEEIDPDTYAAVTFDRFETSRDVNRRLRQIWAAIYGKDDPIPGDL